VRAAFSLSVLALSALLVAACATQTGKPPSTLDQAPTAPPAGAPGAGGAPAVAVAVADLTAATPEDAVKAYLAGLAKGNAAALLAATSSAQQATRVQFDAYVDRLKAFTPMVMAGPASDPFYAEVNRAQLQGQLLEQARMLAYSLLDDQVTSANLVSPVDAAWATTFATTTSTAKLAGLTVTEVAFPLASKKDDATLKAAWAKSAAAWGADEQTERIALLTLDGRTWLAGFTLLRYGSGWGVSNQAANLIEMDGAGAARPMTPEEFDSLAAN
jgi:hypothetical protein